MMLIMKTLIKQKVILKGKNHLLSSRYVFISSLNLLMQNCITNVNWQSIPTVGIQNLAKATSTFKMYGFFYK